MEDTKVIEEELQHYDVVDDDEDWDYDEDFDDEEFDIDVDDDDELQHHGTKGMKWGVRRFQNADGSLTPAGRKRYGSLTDAVGAVKAYHIKQKRKKNLKKAREAAAEKKRIEAEQKAAAEQRKKDVAEGKVSARNMTAEELQSRIDKLNLEKRYKQLMEETNPQAQTVSAGKALVKKFINEAVVPAAVSAGKAALTEKLTEQAKKQLGLTDDDLAVLKKEADTWNLKQQISNAKKTVSDNDKKMNGEEDESARLKKEADAWNLRQQISNAKKTVSDNDKKMNGEEDESSRLEREAKDAKNRYFTEKYTNDLAKEKGYTDDPDGGARAADKMRTKDEAQKRVDSYNESGYTQDTVRNPEINYPKSTKISNPPAVYEKAVTSLANISTNSKEYSDMADRGEKAAYEVLDKDGNIITRLKHSEIFGEDIAHWEISEEELQHWGIKGMKWGQRRFQNKDGSLTPEGKKRYSEEYDGEKAAEQKRSSDEIREIYNTSSSRYEATINIKNSTIVNDMYNDKRLNAAKKELDDADKMAQDFTNLSKDELREYKIKAAKIANDKHWHDNIDDIISDDIYLMYEDWDQGDNSSFDLYLKDRGSSLDNFKKTKDDAENKYRRECAKIIDEKFGEHSDERVAEHVTVKSITLKALVQKSWEDEYKKRGARKTALFMDS